MLKRIIWMPVACVWIVVAAQSSLAGHASTPKPTGGQALSGQMSVDLGMVDAYQTDAATHVFTLTNASHSPVTVGSLETSCRCEHVELLSHDREVQALTVKPGESFQVRMSITLEAQQTGQVTKAAWVNGVGGETLASLSLSFKARQPYLLQPERLDFGVIPARMPTKRTVVLTVDRVALHGGAIPPLLCDNPELHIAQIGAPVTTTRDGKPALTQRYSVSMPNPTTLGSFMTSLYFKLNEQRADSQQETIFLPVTAQIAGDISAEPSVVYFGDIPAGQTATKTFKVTARSAKLLRRLTVSSDSAWITTRPSSAAVIANARAVTVTISGDAPRGPLYTFLTVESDNGEKLRVPVRAVLFGQ